MTPHKRRRAEHGATLVELALVFPLLLTVMFGIVESGRLALTYTALAEASRSATRYAIVHGSNRKGTGIEGPSGPGDPSNVQNEAWRITSAATLPKRDVTVTVTYPEGNGVGKSVNVLVYYEFAPVMPFVPISVPLWSTSEGRICF